MTGPETSPGSYALVCPGVALSVMTHFWLNKGLVEAGLVDKFSVAYWGISAIALALQLSMIVLVWMLATKHFRAIPTEAAVPAELTPTPQTRQDTAPPSRRGGFFHVACNSFRHPQGANIEMAPVRCYITSTSSAGAQSGAQPRRTVS